MSPLKIDFVTTGLDVGGAELMLARLAGELRRRDHQVRVASLTASGPIADRLAHLEIETTALGITPATLIPGVFRLAGWLRRGRANLIQTWMYHANLLGTIANRFAGNKPLVWGIRQSNLHPKRSKKTTRIAAALGGSISGYANNIVCCAESVRRVHESLGYDAKRLVVIPNGVDVNEFRPVDGARRRLGNELGVDVANAKFVGLIGRFDPQKDHGTFLKAAGMFAAEVQNTNVVLCGNGMERNNEELAKMLESLYGDRGIHLLGVRTDIPDIIAGLDLLVSSASYGEGFPNVVAEAMACQVPVVGTNVGETASIVGKYGWVVEPGDPRALTDAMLRVFSMNADERRSMCERARAHIERTYSLKRMYSSYESLYMSCLQGVA